MSSRYTTDDAIAIHESIVEDWTLHGPQTVWDSIQHLDRELLALVVMLHAGAAATRG